MKKLSIILVIFLAYSPKIFSQKNVIYSKKGVVSFSRRDTITNDTLFKKSIKEKQQYLLSGMLKAAREDGIQSIDSLELQKILPILTQSFTDRTSNNILYYHHYRDSIIKSFQTNDSLMGDTMLINIKNSDYVYLSKKLNKIYTKPQSYEYAKNKEINITEFKKERKTIKGFNCFKIILKYKKDLSEGVWDMGEMIGVPNNEYSYTEFWVTEEIKSMFHPICRVKEVLTKYYPLEIIERNGLMPGFESAYVLKEISLAN